MVGVNPPDSPETILMFNKTEIGHGAEQVKVLGP